MLEFLTLITASISFAQQSLLPSFQSVKTPVSIEKQIAPTPSKTNSDGFAISHKSIVNETLNTIVADNIWQTLNHLTSYPNRSATEQSGLDAAKWLKTTFESMAIDYDRKDTKAFFVNTGWYKQPSLVTVIGKDLKSSAIIIGAHMDTPDGKMPGADEGSGAAIIMEAARVLLESKTQFKHPIYIVWYGAGNRDFAGSQYVVQYFEDHLIPVKAVINLDKTGYRTHAEDATMWVYNDFTDIKLTEYIRQLIKTYVHAPVDSSTCNYKCSDHAIWNEQKISVGFSSESSLKEINPYIGTSSDTMDYLNLEHMTNFCKLALAFAIELASD
ncbi:M28 family peptidase [Legionella waltersii]|uniref:Aminopeptidase n=1 Tax=Legionella waltersii TaxID=66969 RepID=A0A0W1ADJ6_9GAMM|nr:M28 family peptidase [Legionella waltersii]KTD79414.1 aminopeptidase [Legionella waltersii]SNU97800.1 aminopeptidase [Legionella waltersii]